MNPWRWNIQLWPRNPFGEGMPEYFGSRVKVVRTLYFVVVVPLVGLMVLSVFYRSFIIILPLCLLLQLVPIVFFTIWPRYVRRQVIRELQEHDHLLCLSCGYPLAGLSDRHVCPECGRAFDPDGVRANWRFWVEHRRLPKRS